MKKVLYVLLFLILLIPSIIFASEKQVNMYLFYGDGCPHCAELEKYLNKYLKEKDNVKLYKYEVWYNSDNVKKYNDVHDILKDKSTAIPYLVIGNTSIVGYSKEVTPERIRNTVEYYTKLTYKDDVGIYLGVVDGNTNMGEDTELSDNDKNLIDDGTINIPIIGKRSKKDVPLLISTILIGLVDGFNPCAMWILIFLISMLITMENKKRRWSLGFIFLLTSALVYFSVLVAWLDLKVFLDKTPYFRAAVASIAILFGFYIISKFITNELLNKGRSDGCEVVNTKNRKRIIIAIRKIVKEKSFILAAVGIILLALSVNLIELLCSLGLPAVYSELLSINGLSKTSKVIYSLIYVFFFMLDDMIVFIIAMKTLEVKAISNKFGKYSHLIGGIIMLIIGLLMVYKPEWLMFNF